MCAYPGMLCMIQIQKLRRDEVSSLLPPRKGRGQNKTIQAAGIPIPFTLTEEGVGSWTKGQTSPLTSFSSSSQDGTQPGRVSPWPRWEAGGQPIAKTMGQHCWCPAHPGQAPCLPRSPSRPFPCPAPHSSITGTALTPALGAAGTFQGCAQGTGLLGHSLCQPVSAMPLVWQYNKKQPPIFPLSLGKLSLFMALLFSPWINFSPARLGFFL